MGGGGELEVERWREGDGRGGLEWGGGGRKKTPVFEPLFPTSKAE